MTFIGELHIPDKITDRKKAFDSTDLCLLFLLMIMLILWNTENKLFSSFPLGVLRLRVKLIPKVTQVLSGRARNHTQGHRPFYIDCLLFLGVHGLFGVLVGVFSSISPKGLWICLHHELNFTSEQLVLWPGPIPAGPLNGTCTTLHCRFFVSFLMLFSLDQKATSVSICWNLPCSSKPPGQEAFLMWSFFPETFHTHYAPVLLHTLPWIRVLDMKDVLPLG